MERNEEEPRVVKVTPGVISWIEIVLEVDREENPYDVGEKYAERYYPNLQIMDIVPIYREDKIVVQVIVEER